MAFDRIPYQLLDVGTEADLISWDSSGEPTVFTLGLGEFLYKDAAGALASVGAGATAGQVIVSDGAGGWLVDDQTGTGGGGTGVGSFEVDRQRYVPVTDYTPGATTELQLPIEPSNKDDVQIFFDSTFQGLDSFSITDNINPGTFDTVTFTAAIPLGVAQVEAIVFGRPAAINIVFDPLSLPTTIAVGTNVQVAIEQLDTYLANINAGQVAFDDTELGSGATTVQEALDDIITTPGLIATPFVESLWLISDERPAGTDGGSALAGGIWRTRTLNVEDAAIIPFGGESLAADQITLPDGEYYIEMQSVFNTDSDGPLGNTRTRLHNITDDVTEILSFSNVVDGGATIQGNAISTGCGKVTVAGGPKVFELQYRVEFSRDDRGLGAATNFDTEIYAIVKIWKVG